MRSFWCAEVGLGWAGTLWNSGLKFRKWKKSKKISYVFERCNVFKRVEEVRIIILVCLGCILGPPCVYLKNIIKSKIQSHYSLTTHTHTHTQVLEIVRYLWLAQAGVRYLRLAQAGVRHLRLIQHDSSTWHSANSLRVDKVAHVLKSRVHSAIVKQRRTRLASVHSV